MCAWKGAQTKLTEFNVCGTQNIAFTSAWFTMYLTASGPAEKQNFPLSILTVGQDGQTFN